MRYTFLLAYEILLFSSLLLSFSCKNDLIEHEKEAAYSYKIKKNNWQCFYDTAKWYSLYINLDRKLYITRKNTSTSTQVGIDSFYNPPIEFSFIEQRFDSSNLCFLKETDTSLCIGLSLSFHGVHICEENIDFNHRLILTRLIPCSFLFKKQSKQLIAIYSISGLNMLGAIEGGRYKEVFKNILRRNREKVDPWLLKEAKKRGYMN